MKIITIFLLLLICSGCTEKNPALMKGRQRLAYLNAKSNTALAMVQVGMSKDQVKTILGAPDNYDDTYVWLYSSIDENDYRRFGWGYLREHGGEICLTFYNDKLTHRPYKASEDSPIDTLLKTSSITERELNNLLIESGK